MAALIGVVAVLAWLGGAFMVMARGYILPAMRSEEWRLEVAEERGWFDGIDTPSPPPASETDRASLTGLMATASEVGKRKRAIVAKAWQEDPEFKAEVRRRYREHYVKYHAEYSLFIGGAWAFTFVLVEPVNEALVPEGLDVLAPVYALVAPLWIAAAMIALLEGLKTARRRSKGRRY
ncbi:hypothetical protein [Glycomyces sp. YM15]|uniref:hypothetical protein n=1 Tax=Glycomyces sp. YM15 TaxID=2800446 RepID=UPI0019641A16|nr:hypothetical protein [Glycomyces sp. YM15]